MADTGVEMGAAAEAAHLVLTQERLEAFEVAPIEGREFRVLSGVGEGWGMRSQLRRRYGTRGFAKALAKLSTGTRFLYCVLEDGRIVHDGWLLLSRGGTGGPRTTEVLIGPINTDPDRRGKGLAPYGLRLALNEMIERGHGTFVIRVAPGNVAGLRVVEKCGFGPPPG